MASFGPDPLCLARSSVPARPSNVPAYYAILAAASRYPGWSLRAELDARFGVLCPDAEPGWMLIAEGDGHVTMHSPGGPEDWKRIFGAIPQIPCKPQRVILDGIMYGPEGVTDLSGEDEGPP